MKTTLHLFLIILLFHISSPVKAHFGLGGEWSYSTTNTKGIYHVRFSLYTECSGLPVCADSCNNFSCFTQIYISSGDASNTSLGFADLQLTSVSELSYGLCSEVNTVCRNRGCKTAGTFSPGFEKYTFEGDVDLRTSTTIPASLCAIRLSYMASPRHSFINTGMASQDFYTELIINRCNADKSQSPVFSNDPKMLVCGGQPLIYNNAAIDPDNDSLSYSFAPALVAAGTSAKYIPPFSALTPLPWTGPANGGFPSGIRCDPVNGDIMLTPSNASLSQFVGVMVTEIKEWRKIKGVYQLLSITRREVEVYIVDCQSLSNNPNFDNAPRIITSPISSSGQPITKWEVNAGNTLCFDILAKDTDYSPPSLSDTTYLSWLANLPGATFTPNYTPSNRKTTGPREDSYKFCWTPDDSLGRNLPYYFYVNTNDGRCPITANMSRVFSVQVYSSKAKAIITKESPACGKWKLSYAKTDSSQLFKSTRWKVAKQPFDYTFSQGADTFSNVSTLPYLNFTKKGKYLIELSVTLPSANNYTNVSVLRDTLMLDSMAFIDAPIDTFICSPGPQNILFSPTYSPSTAQVLWYLLPDRDTFINDSAQLLVNGFTGARTYLIKARDMLSGCTSSDSFTIVIDHPSAVFTADKDSICQTDTATFKSISPFSFSSLTYRWKTGDGEDYDQYNLSHKYQADGQYDVTLIVNNLNLCSDSSTKHVTVMPKPLAAFVCTKDSQCLGNTFHFINQSSNTGNTTQYLWNTGDSNVFNGSAISRQYGHAGKFNVQLTAFSLPGCADSFSRFITVLPKPTASFSIQRDSLCEMKFFSLKNQSSDASSYTWDMGDGHTYTQANPLHKYQLMGRYNIHLVTTSLSNCRDSMDKTVHVSPNPIALFSYNKKALCLNDPLILFNQSLVQTSNYSSLWLMGDGTTGISKNFTHIYQEPGEYKVQLFVTNAYVCTDSIDYTFNIWPRPLAPVISGDTAALQYSTNIYTVPFRDNSTWQWFIKGDTSHTSTDTTVTVVWDYQPEGGSVQVVEFNEHGCASDTSSLKIELTKVTGIPEINTLNSIRWYPVPTKDVLYFTSPNCKINHIRLYNLEGKELLNFSQEEILKRELSLKNIATGIYLLKLESGNNSAIKKINIIK